jgi:Xaa-Pro dipeptidase
MNYSKRSENLSSKLEPKNIECVAITTPPNLRYFFNYSGQSFERLCCGLMSKDGSRSALVIPKLDTEKAAKSHADNIFTWNDNEGYRNALMQALESVRSKGEHIGCELGLTLGLMDQLKNVFGPYSNFLPVSEEISSLRLIKDQEEVHSIQNSASKLSRAYKEIPDIIEEDKTEAEIAFKIVKKLSAKGLRCSDYPLVQSGRNSAIPHSEPGSRKIRRRDMIVVDISATNDDGYFADFTRTYVVGKPSQKQTEVYEKVREAQASGLKASVLGKEAEEVDRAARSSIEGAGYGQFFVHRTGHGLGLEVHEGPFIKQGNNAKLENGMVFTVEPGIYIPGNFGVRIEDNIIIQTESRNITTLSHELVEI